MIDQAAALFAEFGYRSTTLSLVADRLGIAKATLFHHFSTKEQMLFTLYERAMELALARIAAVDDSDADAAVVVRAMVREHALVILQNRELFTIFFAEEAGLEAEHLDRVRSQQADYVNLIARRVSDLIEDGRVGPEVHPHIAVQALIGAGGWTLRWFEPDGDLTVAEIADMLSDLLVDGLLTRA